MTIDDPSIISNNGGWFLNYGCCCLCGSTGNYYNKRRNSGTASAVPFRKFPTRFTTARAREPLHPDDFILAYGLREAIQLTNIDNADAIEPNTDKLWMAIEDAAALIDNYINQASRAGKLLISSNRRRTCLIIARYYLDTVRRREDVKSDYEMCIKELDKSRTLEDTIRPDLPSWLDPCNPVTWSKVFAPGAFLKLQRSQWQRFVWFLERLWVLRDRRLAVRQE